MGLRLVLSFYFVCFVAANLGADDAQISESPVETSTQVSKVEDEKEIIQVSDDTRSENVKRREADEEDARRQQRTLYYYQSKPRQIWQNKKQQFLDGKHQSDSIDFLSVLKLVLSILQEVKQNPGVIGQLIADVSTEILAESQNLASKNQIKTDFIKSVSEKFQDRCGLKNSHFENHPKCSAALNTLADSYFDSGKYLQYILELNRNPTTQVQKQKPNTDLNSFISEILNNFQQPSKIPSTNQQPNNPTGPDNSIIQALKPESPPESPNNLYGTEKPKMSYWWHIHNLPKEQQQPVMFEPRLPIDKSLQDQQPVTYLPWLLNNNYPQNNNYPKDTYIPWLSTDKYPQEPQNPETYEPWLLTGKYPKEPQQQETSRPWPLTDKYPQELQNPETYEPWLLTGEYPKEPQQQETNRPWSPTDKYQQEPQNPETYGPWLLTGKYPKEPQQQETNRPWPLTDKYPQEPQNPETYEPWSLIDKYQQEPQQPVTYVPWFSTDKYPENPQQQVTYKPWLYPQEPKHPVTYGPWLPNDKPPQGEQQPVTYVPWLPTDKSPQEDQPVTHLPWLSTDKPAVIVSPSSTAEPNGKKDEIQNYIHQIISEHKFNDNIENVLYLIQQNRPVFKPQLYDVLFALLDSYKTGAIDSQRFYEIFEFLIRPQETNNVWDEEKTKYLWQFLQPDTSGQVDSNNLNLILKLIQTTKQNPYSINLLSQILPSLQTSKEKPNDYKAINAILALLDADKKLSPQQTNVLISLIRPDKNGSVPPKNLEIITILSNLDRNRNLNADDINTIFSLLKPNNEGRVDEKVVDILYELFTPAKSNNLSPDDVHKILNFLKVGSTGNNNENPKRIEIVLFILNNADQAPVTNSLIPLLGDDIENLKNIKILLYLNSKGLRNAQIYNDLITALKEEKEDGIVEPSKLLSQIEPHLRTEPESLIDIMHILRPNNSTSLPNLDSNNTPDEMPLLIYLLSKGINPFKDDININKYLDKPKVNDYDWLYKLFQEPQWSGQNISPVTVRPKENDFIELTYKIKAEKPVLYHPVQFVKYKIPLTLFMENAKILLAQNPRLLANPAELLQKLIIEKNAAEISPNLLGYPEHDNILKFTYMDGELVHAKVLAENTLKENDQMKSPNDIYSNSDVTPQEILLLSQNNANHYPSKPVTGRQTSINWPFLLGSRLNANDNVPVEHPFENLGLGAANVDTSENAGDLDLINQAENIYDPTPVDALRYGGNKGVHTLGDVEDIYSKQESVDSNNNDVRPLRLTRVNAVIEPKEEVKKPQVPDDADLTKL